MATTPRPKQHRHTQPPRARWGARPLNDAEKLYLGTDVEIFDHRVEGGLWRGQVTSLSERKGHVWATDGVAFRELHEAEVERGTLTKIARESGRLALVEVNPATPEGTL